MANPESSGMPTESLISSIFEWVDLAVEQVSDIVNNHADRLANNPCAWRNDIDTVRRTITPRISAAVTRANRVSVAGITAINSCIASAGIWSPSSRWALGSITLPFWQWLDVNGVPTGPYGVFAPITQPSGASNRGIQVMAGVYLYQNKLRGPRVRELWDSWVAMVRNECQPVNMFPFTGGWRGVLAQLTGYGQPAWKQGDPFAPESRIGVLISRRDELDRMYSEAEAACAGYSPPGNNDTPPFYELGQDSDGSSSSSGSSILALALALLVFMTGKNKR